MKWKDKLKTFLAETATAEKMEDGQKTALTKADETTPAGLSSAFVSAEFRETPKNSTQTEDPSLVAILNEMVNSGAKFEVGEDEFQVINAGSLSQLDRDFLKINNQGVLCTLQQALLVQHLFSNSQQSLSNFASEIAEREKSLAATVAHANLNDIHFQAVCEVTRRWYSELLQKIEKD